MDTAQICFDVVFFCYKCVIFKSFLPNMSVDWFSLGYYCKNRQQPLESGQPQNKRQCISSSHGFHKFCKHLRWIFQNCFHALSFALLIFLVHEICWGFVGIIRIIQTHTESKLLYYCNYNTFIVKKEKRLISIDLPIFCIFWAMLYIFHKDYFISDLSVLISGSCGKETFNIPDMPQCSHLSAFLLCLFLCMLAPCRVYCSNPQTAPLFIYLLKFLWTVLFLLQIQRTNYNTLMLTPGVLIVPFPPSISLYTNITSTILCSVS